MTDFTLSIAEDGVAIIRFDAVGRSMNTLTAAGWDSLEVLLGRVVEDAGVVGAVIVSGKDNGFCAGADLDEMMAYAGSAPTDLADQQARFDALFRGNRIARAIETCGKPFVAAIEGLALGGGFELALACHYRIANDDARLRLGLPEATIGLLPGGGGTQRVARRLGVERAMPILLEGKTFSPQEGLELGLIDALAPAGDALAAARRWILAGGEAIAPWDRKDFVLPGGGPYSASGNAAFIAAAARVARTSMGNYPAQANIARAVYEGVQVPMDKAIGIETRYFLATLQSPQAKAMIRTLFGSHPALRKGPRSAPGASAPVGKVAVLGAGMMGAGIAYSLAKAGIETVLVDMTLEGAEAGKAYSTKLLGRLVAKGLTTQVAADQLLGRIQPTADYADVGGSDLVIETVFEDVAVKAAATQKALAFLPADVLVASNTSTLPISRLAEAHPQPGQVLGMHFHSPVDRMELVEVVRGPKTTPETLERALRLVRQIGKTAIIANDAPFFYTSRVFDTYIREGMEMLVDGVAPTMIDQVGRMTGMPRGPLELTDDVAIDLIGRIAEQRRRLLGDAAGRRRSDDVVDVLLSADRLGRKNGRGFYDYPADGPKRLWDELAVRWPVTSGSSSPDLTLALKRRLLHRQAVEAARCLDEGVLEDPRHADVGAILGWNFPRWTGGPLSYIDQIGVGRFVAECDALAQAHGERFSPPLNLRALAASGGSIYEAAERSKAAA